MKKHTIFPMAGLAVLSLASCKTTKTGYDDPYYGNSYQQSQQQQGYSQPGSDYVQVTPGGQQGYSSGNAYQDYQGAGGDQYSGQQSYQQPSYQSQGGSYSDGQQQWIGSSGGGGGSYTVQRGDNLYRISKRHNTTVEAIMSANGLNSTLIRPGDVLSIP